MPPLECVESSVGQCWQGRLNRSCASLYNRAEGNASWQYQPGAAFTTPYRSARPSLLLFYHIDKTGGASVVSWLGKLVMGAPQGEAPRLSALYTYGKSACATRLFPDVFGHSSPSSCLWMDWRHSAVAVEFHAGAGRDDEWWWQCARARARAPGLSR